MGVTVRVPASVANLGPGFDSFGLAVGCYDECRAEDADVWSVSVEGAAADIVPEGEDNAVVRVMKRVFEEAGEPHRCASLHYASAIPVGGGLGSSGAAAISGLMAADALLGTTRTPGELVDAASRIEGHGDNVAASLLGGFTIVLRQGERFVAERLEPSAGLAVVVVTSNARLDTGDARRHLPDEVPFEDAAFNASRAGALVAGLLLGDRELASRGFEDRLHEARRAELIPDLEIVRSALVESGAEGAVLSGAGPTVAGILLDVDDSSALERAVAVAERAEGLLSDVEGRSRPLALPVDRCGAEVT